MKKKTIEMKHKFLVIQPEISTMFHHQQFQQVSSMFFCLMILIIKLAKLSSDVELGPVNARSYGTLVV